MNAGTFGAPTRCSSAPRTLTVRLISPADVASITSPSLTTREGLTVCPATFTFPASHALVARVRDLYSRTHQSHLSILTGFRSVVVRRSRVQLRLRPRAPQTPLPVRGSAVKTLVVAQTAGPGHAEAHSPGHGEDPSKYAATVPVRAHRRSSPAPPVRASQAPLPFRPAPLATPG
jgi:hypothetical protein